MKLYDAVGPNPRLVRMFLAEKGVELPTEQVDIMAGQNRQAPYTDANPFGQMPALELDDGRVIGETTVICEYLEEKHPTPVLVGATPEERAETRMWTRRAVLNVIEPMSAGFRFAEGLSMFQGRMRCMPDASADFKAVAQDGLALFDGLIEGRAWIVGDRFTLADIALYTLLDFFATVGQPLDPERKNVGAWFERVGARPSAEASLHPVAAGGGMRA
ncbi:MAG: glutathione S-transferase family protein [Myxococcota bacterium]